MNGINDLSKIVVDKMPGLTLVSIESGKMDTFEQLCFVSLIELFNTFSLHEVRG